jgi:hypothetical protein
VCRFVIKRPLDMLVGWTFISEIKDRLQVRLSIDYSINTSRFNTPMFMIEWF